GLSRPSFSQADLEARQWLKNKIKQAGLFLRQDGAGNIFGRLGGEGKVVMAGSHLDTVINGGPFDGSVGVISALECLRRIKEEGLNLAKPLEVTSFSDEEGNLVGDFLGSRAFVGSLEKEKLEKSLTQFGTTLVDILARTEFTIETILQAHRQRPDIEAFIELHIEQGTVLESEDKTIGIVEKIAGKQYRWCSFEGKASHAGTTPFELRHDAFLGLADFALKTTQYVATNYYGSLLTIGKVAVSPGSFSIVPARADFSLDFRSTSSQILIELEKYTQALAQDIASTRGLKFNSLLQDKTEPVTTSKQLTSIISEECQKLGYSFLRLSSGAGHDAQILATVTDSAMIFIPCVDGLSHSPQENINWDDLEKGANLLLQVLIRLAS
ncbi:MAG: Zn-dependent hydrolase, partial [Candidatus Aminicenantales bacterium]